MDRYNEDGELDPLGTFDENGDEIDPETLRKEQNRVGFQQRKLTKENESLKAQLEQIQRERAFEKAGIDPADEKAAYFVKGYDGDLTPEAVKAEAVKIGLIAAEAAPEAPAETPDGQAALGAQQRIIDAAAGATTPLTGLQGMAQEQQEAYEKGGTPALLDVLRKQGLPIADGG